MAMRPNILQFATVLAPVACVCLVGVRMGDCEGRRSRTSSKVAPGLIVVDPAICARLVSSQFGDTYFPGMARTTKATKITPDVVACDIQYATPSKVPSSTTARIELLCGAKITDDGALAAARQQYRSLGIAVPSLGKLAYAFGPGDLQFWDDDSTCSVRIYAAHLSESYVDAAPALASELGPHAAVR